MHNDMAYLAWNSRQILALQMHSPFTHVLSIQSSLLDAVSTTEAVHGTEHRRREDDIVP